MQIGGVVSGPSVLFNRVSNSTLSSTRFIRADSRGTLAIPEVVCDSTALVQLAVHDHE
jgi:hypothetical protein